MPAIRSVAVAVVLSSFHSAFAAGPVVLNPDGAWCWFQDERAVVYRDKMSVASIGHTGDVQVTTWDFKSGMVGIATLRPKFEIDDHNVPGLLIRHDGRLMAFYTQHGGPKQSNPMLWRITARPWDASEWGPEHSFRAGAAAGFSYANPFQLPAENNRIYLFWRSVDFNPTWSATDDDGATWRTVANHIYYKEGERPYVKYASNGTDAIHFAFTDGHPNRPFRNNLYHAYYRQGGLYRSDGTFIRKLVEGAVQVPEATRIYDGESPEGEAWVWDMRLDKSGKPVIAYSSHIGKNDNRYRYARWTGSKWEDWRIGYGGGRISENENNYYAGGVCLDPDDLNVVYVSTNVTVDGKLNRSGHWEISKGTTRDGGKNWSWTPITKDSFVDNLRPIVPAGHPGKTFVLWFRGSYPAYRKFQAEVVAWTDAKLPAIRRGEK